MVYGLNVFAHPFSSRIVQPLPLSLILIGAILSNVLYSTTVYLRAHKREPYALLSSVNALITGSLSLFLGMKYAIDGVALAYFLTASLLILPWQLIIFALHKKKIAACSAS
jgi:membrane protein CcdC involved in cytochrome C biogenesis